MITGEGTVEREAVIEVIVRGPGGEVAVRCVLDTGFTEYLTLPGDLIQALSLPFEQAMPLSQADGQPISVRSTRPTLSGRARRGPFPYMPSIAIPWLECPCCTGAAC